MTVAALAGPVIVLLCWAAPALPGPVATALGRAREAGVGVRWLARFAVPVVALAVAGTCRSAAPHDGPQPADGWPLAAVGAGWPLLPAGMLVGAGELACAALLCGALGEPLRRNRSADGTSQWSALQRGAWMREAAALPGAGALPPGVPLVLGLVAAWVEQAAVFGVGVADATRAAGPFAGAGVALAVAVLRARWPDARRSPRTAPVALLLVAVVEAALFRAVPLVPPLAGARWAFLLLARTREEPSSAGRPAVVHFGGDA